MDALDREILSALQEDGRATMTDVASKVGLSLSACHRRFRDLEAAGVIRGFSVELDLDLLGLPFEALVFVTMRAGDAGIVSAFEEAVARIPNVVQAHRLFGEPDYQLFVAARSKQHYQELYDERLSQLPGVRRLNSTLVMKTVVEHHAPV
ncbi:Lrp/AsnC family transcriptional regulator [Leucobacter luti]|uniref:AsnC family transcriptional regulator n=1 Tax=Leucobacter luti TaxID=340320 RepID=A0A4R6RWM3_9MICO|nr:Lrp/AsnC family transcriptional regulator [Leucobacter luti]QYM75856.1 Lrp/AsnC family transcriptional regulator [Leucobacter luti]TDP91431.1 AsnC family transcriptional regulator [Leucobacter luti]